MAEILKRVSQVSIKKDIKLEASTAKCWHFELLLLSTEDEKHFVLLGLVAISISIEALKGPSDAVAFTASWLSQLSAPSTSGMLLLPGCLLYRPFSALLRVFSCCCSRHKLASFHDISERFGKHVALKPRLCLASQTHGKTIALLSVQTESSCLSQMAQTVPARYSLDTGGC